MYSVLGWANAIVLGVLLSPFVLGLLNKHIFKTRSKGFRNLVKLLRSFHKSLGLALAVLAPIHGYMALGGFRLHTGSLLYLSAFITAALGGSFYRLKKKELFKWHKRMAAVTVILLAAHLLFPGALRFLMN